MRFMPIKNILVTNTVGKMIEMMEEMINHNDYPEYDIQGELRYS